MTGYTVADDVHVRILRRWNEIQRRLHQRDGSPIPPQVVLETLQALIDYKDDARPKRRSKMQLLAIDESAIDWQDEARQVLDPQAAVNVWFRELLGLGPAGQGWGIEWPTVSDVIHCHQKLQPIERQALRIRYGMDGHGMRTLKETAGLMGYVAASSALNYVGYASSHMLEALGTLPQYSLASIPADIRPDLPPSVRSWSLALLLHETSIYAGEEYPEYKRAMFEALTPMVPEWLEATGRPLIARLLRYRKQQWDRQRPKDH